MNVETSWGCFECPACEGSFDIRLYGTETTILCPNCELPLRVRGPAPEEGGCDRCDTFGSEKTLSNQACLPLNGRIVCVDWCIHHIVAALNAGGVQTVASCCGHGRIPGRIDLADGRVLSITKEPQSLTPTRAAS